MDEWEHDGLYEQHFILKLTAKHGLAVGSWISEDDEGVDLRRLNIL